VTYNDLIQATTQSFRNYGKSKEDMSDSNNEVIATAKSFKFNCNLCGKGGHKAKDCPQHDKIKCEHCHQLRHKKVTCWKLEANKSKRPEWWMDTVAVSIDDGKIIPYANCVNANIEVVL
jgi:hypothetical protein